MNESRQSYVSESVRATRLNFLLLQSPFGVILSPLACLALSVTLTEEVSYERLLVWNLGMFALAAVRLAVWLYSPRKRQSIARPRMWELALCGTTVAVALWWGLGAMWVLPTSLQGRLLIFVGLMMMAGGTYALYSVHPVPTMASILAMTVPISCAFILQPETLLQALGYGTWLFLLGTVRGIQMLNHFLVRSHELTYDLERNIELLKRSEQMREDLTLMLVHDLRTPLSSLIGRARLARELNSDGDFAASAGQLDRVETISRTLVGMINCILDVNRLENDSMPLNSRSIGAEELLRRALGAISIETKQIEVRASEGLCLQCDPELVERVLVNLLGNALRYQPVEEPLKVCFRLVDSELAEFRVIDRGPGVPEQDRDLIFDKYGQASRENRRGQTSGLGLTFCKMVVERHGGSIGVDSVPGRGSEFWFRLPRSRRMTEAMYL